MVSIITPLYNSEQYIAETISSVQGQSYKNWEMLIVDDQSTDKGFDIAAEFARRDDRIRVSQLEKNIGPAYARNEAIKQAEGKFIAFLDSDDLWHSNKLERQISYMLKNNYPFTYSYYELVDMDGGKLNKVVKPPESLNYKDLLKENQVGCLTAVYDRNYFGKVYMPILRNRQDYGLWLKLVKKAGRAYCLPEVLALYRNRPGSISTNKVKMIGYHYKLFRQVEELSLPKTLYYLGWNIKRKLF